MTDTHGYSAFGMGLGKFVGVDLCPRLKSFRDRRPHIPRGGRVKVPDVLKPVCLADVSLPAIIDGGPDMSVIADAVAGGRLSAVLACERHGTAARGQKGYRAGHELGLLLRTLHQCDTLSIPDFRRATLRLLNDKERTHTLQRRSGEPEVGPDAGAGPKSWVPNPVRSRLSRTSSWPGTRIRCRPRSTAGKRLASARSARPY